MKTEQPEILVYAHWHPMTEPTLLGHLFATHTSGKEVFSFEYASSWLQSNNDIQLDPDLQFFSGPQYLQNNKQNFGIFLDSSPDRWGRLLMRRREALSARVESRAEKKLSELDHLLGVYDQHRMGALRFKAPDSTAFLDSNTKHVAPPWTSLRELEQASLKLEKEDAMTDPNYATWLNLLMAPGSSLGGARPKASVLDPNNALWIAKFPSQNDDKDIAAWEMLIHQLATQAGIHTTEACLKQFSSRHHTFLSKRFDRLDNGKRLHFSSAMTMLGYSDGADFHDGVSYLQLAEFIIQHGANVNENLEELWRRIVFNIFVSNTDDHLRNHGFLLTTNGWELSPAYDMNPMEFANGLTLNISENDNSLDLDLAMGVRDYFRINKTRALEIIASIKKAIKPWRTQAKSFGITSSEQNRMAPVLERFL